MLTPRWGQVFTDPGPSEPELTREMAAGGAKGAAAAGPKESTCAIILPQPIENKLTDEIFAAIAEAGFKVAHQEDRTLTAEQAAEFLAAYAACFRDGSPFVCMW